MQTAERLVLLVSGACTTVRPLFQTLFDAATLTLEGMQTRQSTGPQILQRPVLLATGG